MHSELMTGESVVFDYRVPAVQTVPYLFPETSEYQELPRVFATGFMVGLLELGAIKSLNKHLSTDETSVGTLVEIRHSAATPPGAILYVHAECILARYPYYEWKVRAVDAEGVVAASGKHGRNVLNRERFQESICRKGHRLMVAEGSDRS